MNRDRGLLEVGLKVREMIFGPKPPPTVEEAEDAQKDRKQREKAEKTWAEFMSRPAHEYLNTQFEALDLPPDASKICNRLCSFWIKKPGEFWGQPFVARIEAVTYTGNVPSLFLAAGPSGRPARLYLYGKGKGALVERQEPRNQISIMRFEFL